MGSSGAQISNPHFFMRHPDDPNPTRISEYSSAADHQSSSLGGTKTFYSKIHAPSQLSCRMGRRRGCRRLMKSEKWTKETSEMTNSISGSTASRADSKRYAMAR